MKKNSLALLSLAAMFSITGCLPDPYQTLGDPSCPNFMPFCKSDSVALADTRYAKFAHRPADPGDANTIVYNGVNLCKYNAELFRYGQSSQDPAMEYMRYYGELSGYVFGKIGFPVPNANTTIRTLQPILQQGLVETGSDYSMKGVDISSKDYQITANMNATTMAMTIEKYLGSSYGTNDIPLLNKGNQTYYFERQTMLMAFLLNFDFGKKKLFPMNEVGECWLVAKGAGHDNMGRSTQDERSGLANSQPIVKDFSIITIMLSNLKNPQILKVISLISSQKHDEAESYMRSYGKTSQYYEHAMQYKNATALLVKAKS